MIDLHCHILPGLDDGPQTLEESLAMARVAVTDGIKSVVATPHTLNGVYENQGTDISRAVDLFKKALAEQNIPLELYAGSDVHFGSDLIQKLKSREVLSINRGKYVLLELPSRSIPMTANEAFFEMRVRGFIPILTHLERNHVVQKHIEVIGDWIEHGAVIQITAESLTRGFGSRAFQCACRLLERGWVDVMATDAHSADWRPPILSQGLNMAGEIIGPEEALKLVTLNPGLIINNEPLPEKTLPDLPSKPARKNFFFRWFS